MFSAFCSVRRALAPLSLLLALSGLAQAGEPSAIAAPKATATGNALVSITIVPVTNTLYSDASPVQYTATGTYQNGAVADLTDSVTWAVNNAGMDGTCASFNATGVLTPGYCNGWGTTLSATLGTVTTTGFVTASYGNAAPVIVTPVNQSVMVGAAQQYTATWSQLDGASPPQNWTDKVSWSSSNPAVATISASGLVTALAPGKTIITASHTSSGFIPAQTVPNNNAPVLLTVMPCDLQAIAVTPSALTLLKGTVSQYKANGTCTNGAEVDVTAVVDWSTADSSIAMFNPTGLLAGWTTGTTSATASVGGISSASVAINVADSSSLASIQILPQGTAITKGTTKQFSAVGTYQGGSTQDITDSVEWNTDALDVVSIDAKGLATGLTIGSAEITASLNGLASPASAVAVTDTITAIAVTPAQAQIKVLGVQQFKATATYQDGTSQDVTDAVEWTTDAATVVSINGEGVAYGAAQGSAVITAISNGIASPGATLTVVQQ